MTNVKLKTLTGAVDMDKVHYCERFMELLIDLEVHTVYEIITQVILEFWLVLAHDLLEDRRTDDDTARFNFFLIFGILNLNQSQFFAKHSNQSIRFILHRH